jgi:hypothetical protein
MELEGEMGGVVLEKVRTRGYSDWRRAATLARFDLTAYTYS